MTSELKPYAYAYFGKDGQLDGDRFGTQPLTEGDLKAGYSQIPLYTRAVPDVPELVRYSPVVGADGRLEKFDQGPYVRYDQAAEMLAAYDMELAVARHDANYNEERASTASSAMHGLAKRLEELASELHDKRSELAQIKAQEPVGYVSQYGFNKLASRSFQQMVDVRKSIEGEHNIPLYAAPVDQTAEMDRLNSATTHRMD